jgi:hypothetical protein
MMTDFWEIALPPTRCKRGAGHHSVSIVWVSAM